MSKWRSRVVKSLIVLTCGKSTPVSHRYACFPSRSDVSSAVNHTQKDHFPQVPGWFYCPSVDFSLKSWGDQVAFVGKVLVGVADWQQNETKLPKWNWGARSCACWPVNVWLFARFVLTIYCHGNIHLLVTLVRDCHTSDWQRLPKSTNRCGQPATSPGSKESWVRFIPRPLASLLSMPQHLWKTAE